MNCRRIFLPTALLSLSAAATVLADEPVALVRLTAPEIVALAGPGTPGSTGLQSTVLIGDPTKPGLYTVRVSIPAHTQVRPHTHRDNRSVTVFSGTWQMGYGTQFDPKALKVLPPGSVYTEPAGQPHFSLTTEEPVVILVTGYGPNDTQFVTP